MREPFIIFPGFLEDETCDRILEMGLKLAPVQAGVGGEGKIDPEIRSADVRSINYETSVEMPDGPSDFVPLFQVIERKMREANRLSFGFDLSWLGQLQLTTYPAERAGHYSWHHDLFWHWHPYQRKLSAILQLSDPSTYEGGDFKFERYDVAAPPDPAILRRRGTILVFPSPMYHMVEPVTKGVRHSITAWYEGVCWR